jgi:hypothetical protein
MTDDLVGELKADWQRQDVEIVAVKQRLTRWRSRAYLILAADVVGALLALAVGTGFAAIAWKSHDLLFGLSAFTLLVVCPPFIVGVFRERLRSLKWTDRTPEGTLRYALTRTRAIDQILRIGYWSSVVLLSFVALVWACVAAGFISRRYPLIFMTVVWIAAALVAMLWAKWRMRRTALERAHCERLLSKFEDAMR